MVKEMDLGSPRAGGMQSEAAQETEAVENLCAFGEIGDKFIIALLVEIEPGLVAAQEIAFSVDDAEARGVGKMLLTNRQGSASALLEEGLIYFDPFRRKDTDINPGLRIVESSPEESLPMILHLDQFAVGSRVGETKNRTVIYPWMAGENSVRLARF